MTTNVKPPSEDTATRGARPGQAITQASEPRDAASSLNPAAKPGFMFWQTQAPRFCVGGHRPDDMPGDRWHQSEQYAVELTREHAVKLYDGTYEPQVCNVVMVLPDTEREPHIRLNRGDEPNEIMLTVPEARQLAGHLLALADLAYIGGEA